MEITREAVLAWFDAYFRDVDLNQGSIENVPNLTKYFAPDLEFVMHTAPPSSTTVPRSRDSLLVSFVHPGLHEALTPRYYVVDLEQMIVVVQFEIRFRDEPTGRDWPPIQASAHYHLEAGGKHGLRIRKIHYWTGPLPTEIMEVWAERRKDALMACAVSYISKGR